MTKQHRWSKRPGAYCQDCGADSAVGIAIGLGWYDENSGTWDSEQHRLAVAKADGECLAGEDKHDD